MVFPSSSSLNGHPGRPGKRAAGGRGRPGARGPGRGPTVVWAQPGCLGAFSSERLPTYSRLIAHNCSNNRPRTSLLLRAARVLATPASTAEGPRSRAARAAERPAAPVRLGRGGEPPGLISPWCLFPSRVRQAPALDRHVHPRRRHGRPLRPPRRRRDGEDATPSTSNENCSQPLCMPPRTAQARLFSVFFRPPDWPFFR